MTGDTKKIGYGRQWIDDEDVAAVVHALRSDFLTQGPCVKQFEDAMAEYCGVKYVVAVANGTAALHLACLAAGLSAGDEAITTPMTFLATANSIVYTGAKPVFADIQYDTVNIDPEQIVRKLTRRTKAILPVHFAGLPVDLKEVSRIASRKGLYVIEDAAHALGAAYKGQRIGSCRYSDMTTFSFHPVKHITTGEGGCITTNNKALYKKLLTLRHHGIFHSKMHKKHLGAWSYHMHEVGYNYRLTEFQSALGVSQLKKSEAFLKRRKEIAAYYNKRFRGLTDLALLPKLEHPDRRSSWHLYLFRLIKHSSNGTNRRKLFDALVTRGICPQVHYVPVHHHPFYHWVSKNYRKDFPNTERYYSEALSLPMYPLLTDRDLDRVATEVLSILKA